MKKHEFKEKCDFCGNFSDMYEGTTDGKIICKQCKNNQLKDKPIKKKKR